MPFAFQERWNFFLIMTLLPFFQSVLASLFIWNLAAVCKILRTCNWAFFLCICPSLQMVTMTQQVCHGCLPLPPAKMWLRLHRFPMDAATLAWPLVVRRKEAQVCRTPANSVTSPSGIYFDVAGVTLVAWNGSEFWTIMSMSRFGYFGGCWYMCT